MVLDEDIEIVANNISSQKISGCKVLITGATGLLGSIFVKGFLRANEKFNLKNEIFALCRNVNKANEVFCEFKDDKNLFIVEYDLLKPIECEKVDYIFHFAGTTTSKEMVTHPVEVIESTIIGLNNILNFSKDKNVKSVVFTSSMEVFGVTNIDGRLKENDLGFLDLTTVRSSYPESKRLAENLCACYASEYGVNVKVARLTQTFGAGASYDDSRVFGMIARSVVEEKDIVLFSKGDLARDYCYTTDALSAILQIALHGEKGEVYNVANEDAHSSVIDMCNMVASELGNNKIKVKVDIPKNVQNLGFSPACITKLNTSKVRALGWTPKFELKEMFRRLIESYKETNPS